MFFSELNKSRHKISESQGYRNSNIIISFVSIVISKFVNLNVAITMTMTITIKEYNVTNRIKDENVLILSKPDQTLTFVSYLQSQVWHHLFV